MKKLMKHGFSPPSFTAPTQGSTAAAHPNNAVGNVAHQMTTMAAHLLIAGSTEDITTSMAHAE